MGETDIPSKQIGEIVIRGANVTPGYQNNPKANAENWTDGWFRTGDAARLDADGDLWIVDRWKDMYISGGENVYPAEVESVLHTIAGVADAAIVGMPDDTWGEVGVAVIVAEPERPPSAADILSGCEGRLARYKQPKRVVFVDQLPRNATGKILKRVLRDELCTAE